MRDPCVEKSARLRVDGVGSAGDEEYEESRAGALVTRAPVGPALRIELVAAE